jgi:hypothetical protein
MRVNDLTQEDAMQNLVPIGRFSQIDPGRR